MNTRVEVYASIVLECLLLLFYSQWIRCTLPKQPGGHDTEQAGEAADSKHDNRTNHGDNAENLKRAQAVTPENGIVSQSVQTETDTERVEKHACEYGSESSSRGIQHKNHLGSRHVRRSFKPMKMRLARIWSVIVSLCWGNRADIGHRDTLCNLAADDVGRIGSHGCRRCAQSRLETPQLANDPTGPHTGLCLSA